MNELVQQKARCVNLREKKRIRKSKCGKFLIRMDKELITVNYAQLWDVVVKCEESSS